MRRGLEGDEELAVVAVGPAVGHAHHAQPLVRQRRVELVREGVAPDGAAARARARGVAALHHEVLDQPVEHRAVVLALRAQAQEVLRRARHQVAVHLQVQRAQARHQLHVPLLLQRAHALVAPRRDLLVRRQLELGAALSVRGYGRANGDGGGGEGGGEGVRRVLRQRPVLLVGRPLQRLFLLRLLRVLLDLGVSTGLEKNRVEHLLQTGADLHVDVALLALLLLVLLHVVELGHIAVVGLRWVLEDDDIVLREGLTRHQVRPVLLSDVQVLDAVIEIDVA